MATPFSESRGLRRSDSSLSGSSFERKACCRSRGCDSYFVKSTPDCSQRVMFSRGNRDYARPLESEIIGSSRLWESDTLSRTGTQGLLHFRDAQCHWDREGQAAWGGNSSPCALVPRLVKIRKAGFSALLTLPSSPMAPVPCRPEYMLKNNRNRLEVGTLPLKWMTETPTFDFEAH